MKMVLFLQFNVIAIVLAFTGRPIFAEEATPPAQSKDKQESGLMDSTHMKDMMKSRSKCINMHPDGMLCDHQMMEDCQQEMGKVECQKIMKQAKAKEKIKK